VIPIGLISGRFLNGLEVRKWGFGMPKHVCGADLGASMRALGFALHSRNLRHLADNRRCKATAIKTKRGAWRCPLHGGLSTGPMSPEGKARISAAARQRWEAYRAAKAAKESDATQEAVRSDD
jgi:hypothetical protein